MTTNTGEIDWGQIAIGVAIATSMFLQKWDAIRVKQELKRESLTRANAQARRDGKLDAIHGLVNGSMSEQKRMAMVLAKRIAELTKDPADILMAQEAAIDFMEHKSRSEKT